MKQRKDECVLAAACTLAGQDYETASDLFQVTYGYRWGDDVSSQRDRPGWRERWVEFLTYLGVAPAFVGAIVEAAVRVGGVERAPSGRGVAVVTDGAARHAIAVDASGRAYDPSDDRWYDSIEALLATWEYRCWRLEQFIAEGGQ